VRCSGPDARAIAARVFRSREPLRDRVATYGEIVDVDGAVIDRGLALAMHAPRTTSGSRHSARGRVVLVVVARRRKPGNTGLSLS